MSKINKSLQRRNNTIELIKTTLWNRSDDNDMDWGEIDEIKKEIERLVSTTLVSFTTGEKLSLGCETDYFFLSVYNKKSVSSLEMVLTKGLNDYYSDSEHTTHLLESKKIAIVFIVNDLETRAFVDSTFLQKKNDYLKQIKDKLNTKSKIRIDHVFVLNQKDNDMIVEISNVDRYSTIQEPRLYNKLNFEKKAKIESQVGYVATVDLIELIKMYNKVGDKLFANNVRYGISEQLGVNEAIRNTLATEGAKFWYRNNGITILVRSPEFKLNCPNKIVFGENDNFSVINGAQTITVASNFYYEKLAEMERSNVDDNGSEGIDDKGQSPREVIDSIEKARVLLRIICINDEDLSASQKEGNDISVALNRQKPIKVEDIAYTLDYITEFAELLNGLQNEKTKFILKKRGEQVSSRGVMDLVEFSRARLACMGEPIKARNESASVFLKSNVDEEDRILKFVRKDIFIECSSEADFAKHYNGVKFAHDLSTIYGTAKKTVLKKRTKNMSDQDKKYNAIVNNAKWIFISHVVEAINGGVDDYTSFNCSLEDYDVSAMMRSYYDQAFDLTKEETIKLDTFKSKTWANKVRETINMDLVIKQGSQK